MMRLLVLAALAFGVLAGPAGAAIYFDFQKGTNTSSALYETWQDAATGKIYGQQSWRAGSGYLPDECTQNAGWLPNGYYNLVAHYDHYDFKIKGRVWQLSDKACWNGTPRSELFIHSEETADNGQLCGSPYYDERYCWDGDGDYKSVGCIKLSRATPYPSDLAKADNAWHGWGGGTGALNLYHRVYVFGP